MKKIEEQLESIEEVLSLVIRKSASMENLIQTASESQNKTLADTLMALKRDLEHHQSSQHLETYFSQIKQSVVSVPKASEVRHHHHFDLRSKELYNLGSCAIAINSYKHCSGHQQLPRKQQAERN
jgi:hypothetical protein